MVIHISSTKSGKTIMFKDIGMNPPIQDVPYRVTMKMEYEGEESYISGMSDNWNTPQDAIKEIKADILSEIARTYYNYFNHPPRGQFNPNNVKVYNENVAYEVPNEPLKGGRPKK